ncbi:MAG: hypothetical protein EHM70_08220 [Chloroflexota bacterium]|nr:MAG: hypothetical protein EHM70_08220 [Chloroflexota bacterium]
MKEITCLSTLLIVGLLLTSCGQATPEAITATVVTSQGIGIAQPTRTSPDILRSTATLSPTATIFPTETVAPSLTPVPISENGPWLVFWQNQQVVVSNVDGSGLTALNYPIGQHYWPEADMAVSQSGGLIAVRDWTTDHLIVLRLWDQAVLAEISLFSEDALEAASAASSYNHPAPLLNLVEWDRQLFFWSPDGRYLAFAAALDGPSADLHVYDVLDGTTQRLSEEPEQIIPMGWSPDGQWIVFMVAT